MASRQEGKSKSKNSKLKRDDLVLSIDANQKIIKFNEKCQIITGYSENEALSKNFFDLIPSRYHNYWKNMFNSLGKEGIVDEFKIPFLTKSGHEIMFFVNSFPLKNNDGKIREISLVGSIIDKWNDTKESINIDKNFSELKSSKIDEKNPSKIDISGQKGKEKLGKGLYSLSELFGRGKSEEIEQRMNELIEREKILNDLEDQLHEDKVEINTRISEFKKWREKLEVLEEEIENRREDVVKREKVLDTKIAAASEGKGLSVSDLHTMDVDYHEILDKIPDSAAVIQRGILKQVNSPFSELIGYETEEIIDKSLFDFITTDGFSELEEYYLQRLKGVDVSIYETMLLTKDNEQIKVEVSTKPTILNGEKAEIAIFKKSVSDTKNKKIKGKKK